MLDTDTSIIYQDILKWIKIQAVEFHNKHITDIDDIYLSGLAFGFFEIYSLIQMQAESFSIPLNILGLDKLKEIDFLSISCLQCDDVKTNIPSSYLALIKGCFADNMFLILENIKNIYVDNRLFNELRNFDNGKMESYCRFVKYLEQNAMDLDIYPQILKINEICIAKSKKLKDCHG